VTCFLLTCSALSCAPSGRSRVCWTGSPSETRRSCKQANVETSNVTTNMYNTTMYTQKANKGEKVNGRQHVEDPHEMLTQLVYRLLRCPRKVVPLTLPLPQKRQLVGRDLPPRGGPALWHPAVPGEDVEVAGPAGGVPHRVGLQDDVSRMTSAGRLGYGHWECRAAF
jgi:hypothetical protein